MPMDLDIPVAVHPGAVLAGKYRVERVLGQGGMGIVVAAHHLQLDEKVALKFLLPAALANPEAVARFVREARNAVKIKSEHVARVSDVGQLEDGAPYMVMEFLEGGDLAQWLRQNGPLPFEQAVDFVLQACVAVADAHALGIVHRDLKPANLFCVRRSDGHLTIKVLDFGISKTTSVGSSGTGMDLTRTSALMGTPLYMSPEQMRSSREVDGTTDIWALGVILFELMAGKPPFFADSVTELVMQIASDPPPPLCTLRPDAPAGLEAVVGKCLEKDRGRRYRNVGELGVALLPFAPPGAKASVERISGILRGAGISESAVPIQQKEAATGGAPTGTLPPVGRTLGGPQTKPVAIAMGVFATLAVAAVGLFLVLSHKPTGQPPDPAAAAASTVTAAQLSATPEPLSSAPTTAAVQLVASQPSSAPASAPSTTPPNPSITPPKPSPSIKLASTIVPNKRASAVAAPPPAPVITAPAATAKPNCDPPYTLDGQGRKNWKPECFSN